MPIADYLNAIINSKNKLKTILTEKGVAVAENDKLNTLVDKVEQIQGGESSAEPIEKVLYSFGVLSDIHLQSTEYGVDSRFSLTDYQKALTFFKNSKVDLIALPGDIVANNRSSAQEVNAPDEWVAELNLFKEYNELYFPDKPVYTCTGNHDATPYGRTDGDYIATVKRNLEENGTYNRNTFEQVIAENENVGLNNAVITSDGTYDGTKTAAEVWKEIIGTDLHFVVEHNGDVFIFFSMYYWNYAIFCREDDIMWLEEKLEAYKNSRVFLFTHLPITNTFDPSGQGCGVAANGYPLNYRFGQIVSRYKNVVYFSGHTHYDLSLDGTDGNFTNTYQSGESMKQVHCSSGAYTRLPKYDENGNYTGYLNEETGSQGYIVDVYANKIVIKGIDFSQGENGTIIANVNYIIND